MNHDELLAKIKTGNEFLGITYAPDSHTFALRAVVELHKPTTDEDRELVCSQCLLGQEENLDDYYFLYPCPTIKRIIKEMK